MRGILTDGSVLVTVGASKSTTSRIGIYSASHAGAVSSSTLSRANGMLSILAHCDFYRLADEVTERWCRENCPGQRLSSDDADNETRKATHDSPDPG